MAKKSNEHRPTCFYAYSECIVGLLEIVSDGKFITQLNFVNEKREKESDIEILQEAKCQLEAYFNKELKEFNLPIKLEGTDFQVKVWKELMKIPYGTTISYSDLARNVGNELAVRAVGGANNKNKIPIIIPCHRVIGKNGQLVGFGGELWRKEKLLLLEKE